MSTIKAAMSGVPLTLIAAATTGASDVIAIPSSFLHHNFLVTGGAGTTSGKVKLETSNDPDDANTWALIAAEITVVASADLLTNYIGLLNFIRATISTTIAGGTTPSVTVVYDGAR